MTVLRLLALLTLVCWQGVGATESRWPGFRGDGSSVSPATGLPLKWSDSENVRWSSDIRGFGQSSPIVWEDAVFVTSVEGESKETLVVSRFDLKTGKQVWAKTFPASRTTKVSGYVSQSAPTPVADADGVYAFFESGDLFALDPEGNQRWKRSLLEEYGDLNSNHGLGTSLVQSDEALYLLIAQGEGGYLLAVNKKTGENLWRTEQPFGTSWSTPVYAEVDGQPTLLISSAGNAYGFDATTGEQQWKVSGFDGNNVPSPTLTSAGVLIPATDKGSNALIQPQRTKPEDGEATVWKAKNATSSFGSPLVYQGLAYFVNRSGVAFCLDLASGEERWSTRLGDSCWASPVGVEDKVYFFMKDGGTVITQAGAELNKLAENKLTVNGRVYGVAVVDNAFVLRTESKLICLSEKK